jgi:CBS domain-containing protein
MSCPAVVLPAATPVPDALEYMAIRKIRRVPVIQDGVLAGIVTRSDLQAVAARHDSSGRTQKIVLADVMKSPVLTVAPDDTLEHASKSCSTTRWRGAGIMDGAPAPRDDTESDVFEAFNELMGTAENGARIVMTIPADTQLLDSPRRRLKGLSIQSLATYRSQDGSGWEVVVKVCGRRPLEVA